MTANTRHMLRVVEGCAIIAGQDEREVGEVASLADLPKNARRRLSSFDRMVVRCIVGVSSAANVDDAIVFGSSYGNMPLTYGLLQSLCDQELMSPADFSHSVHNAAVGIASQIAQNHGGHTAIAAGADSSRAALIEATVRLHAGAPAILMVLAEQPLPGAYAGFDSDPGAPAVCLAVRLALGETPPTGEVWQAEDNPGRRGMIELAQRLAAPACWLAWT